MAKISNWLVNTIGADKMLHFLVAAWLTALVSPLGAMWMGFMICILFIASVIKEFLDSTFDWYDIMAAMIGCGVTFLIDVILVHLS